MTRLHSPGDLQVERVCRIVCYPLCPHHPRALPECQGKRIARTSMPFTVDDFHDFIRLIETRPEWRTELRRLVLTNELLAVPEQLAELRARSEQQFIALAEAQQRTEARLTALTEQVTTLTAAQQRTETQVATLTAQVTTLAEAQQRTETQVATLTAQVTALTRTVQTLV